MIMSRLVSIVLPVYNGERFLSQSIDSVLGQTYPDFELIIVNDCSTDSTEEIILRYAAKDARIRYKKNEVNSKLPASLNIGFAQAKGEYYTWTSDDNMYHADAIERMVNYLNEHPETGMVSCGYNAINEDDVYQRTCIHHDESDLLLRNDIGACFMYRAEVAKTIGEYRTDLFLIEDYDYWLRISRQYKIDYLQDVLYEYRQHANSLSATRKEKVTEVLGKYQWENLPAYESKPLPDEQLFRFFDYIVSFKKTGFQRRLCMIWFGLKHRKYITRYLKRKTQIALGKR